MKKTMLIGMALGIVALTATSSFATISNSAHDLSSTGGSSSLGVGTAVDTQDRICIYCHTPHNAIKTSAALSYSPLWNRAYQSAHTYTMYENGAKDTNGDQIYGDSSNRHQMNGTPAMSGISILCMSCHDGVTAMNAYSNNNGGTSSGLNEGALLVNSTDVVITGSRNIGGTTGDLSNHHPIGMSWTDSERDPEIAGRTTAFIGTASLTIQDVLEGGDVMTCASCHDVHNADGNAKFLHTPNTHSQFCLTCHAK